MRPKVTFLENVPDLTQQVQLEDGTFQSDCDFIRTDFEENGFTVFIVVISRRDYSSPHNGLRLWIVLFDVLPSVGRQHEQKFYTLLNMMRIPQVMDVGRFLIDPDNLALMDPATVERSAKRVCKDSSWHSQHEELFLENGMTWPPDLSHWPEAKQFRDREQEIIFAANALHPPQAVNRYEFFDANMSLGRVFKPNKDNRTTSPWRDQVPTMSGGCVLVVRKMDEQKNVSMRRLHGLEAMRLQGWDLPLWEGDCSPCVTPQSTSNDLLQNLAGNMWSLFHFVPVFMAAMTAMPWETVLKERIIL